MHSALIRCFVVASMLPSHLQGLEAAGVIVLTIKGTIRLSSHLKKSFSFQCYELVLVLRDPLFFARLMGILISLPLDFHPLCAVACTGPLRPPAAVTPVHFSYLFL